MHRAQSLAFGLASTIFLGACAQSGKGLDLGKSSTTGHDRAVATTATSTKARGEAAAASGSAGTAQPAQVGAASPAADASGLADLHIYSGSAVDMGQQQGQDMGQQINDLVAQWLQPMINQVPLLGSVLANVKANNMSAQVPQDELDEMQAVASAAGADPSMIQIANFAPDLGQISTQGLGAIFSLTQPAAHFGCSSYVVGPQRSATGAMLVGRNLDYPNSQVLLDQWEPVIFAKTGALKILSVHIPGMTGLLTAINERGVYLAIHVSEGALSSQGLPITMLFREVLEQATSTQDAVSLITQAHPALAANVMVTDGKDAAVVEIDNVKSDVRTLGDSGVLYNANHFVTPDMAAEDSAHNVPDDRWPILQSHDNDQQKLALSDLEDVIRQAGGFDGSDASSNILAVTLDYGTMTLTFSSDPSGQAKAIDGGRRFSINVKQAFAQAEVQQ